MCKVGHGDDRNDCRRLAEADAESSRIMAGSAFRFLPDGPSMGCKVEAFCPNLIQHGNEPKWLGRSSKGCKVEAFCGKEPKELGGPVQPLVAGISRQTGLGNLPLERPRAIWRKLPETWAMTR